MSDPITVIIILTIGIVVMTLICGLFLIHIQHLYDIIEELENLIK